MQAISHRVSNEQAKQVLDWQPQYSAVDAVLRATDTLVKKRFNQRSIILVRYRIAATKSKVNDEHLLQNFQLISALF